MGNHYAWQVLPSVVEFTRDQGPGKLLLPRDEVAAQWSVGKGNISLVNILYPPKSQQTQLAARGTSLQGRAGLRAVMVATIKSHKIVTQANHVPAATVLSPSANVIVLVIIALFVTVTITTCRLDECCALLNLRILIWKWLLL